MDDDAKVPSLGAEPSAAALVLIDVVNTMAFPGSEALVARAEPMAARLAALKRRAREAGLATIYVNDNFGRWRSDFRTIVDVCLAEDSPGRSIAKLLEPDEDDYFVLKPKHSGFHATALEVLLQVLGARTLVLTGMAGNICVLFTANDAYMRDYRIVVPSDCIASNSEEDDRVALDQMKRFLKADVRASNEIDLESLVAEP
jgi:nicotinamidase-related amidase